MHCQIQVEPGEAMISVPVPQGFEYQKTVVDFSANLFIDLINNRVKVKSYLCWNFNAFNDYLEYIAATNNLSKTIIIAPESDWQQLFFLGYSLEAINPWFFQGKPGFHLSRFLTPERNTANFMREEDANLKQALRANQSLKSLSTGYQIRTADKNDIPGLIKLFSKVFKSYPTPLNNQVYLEKKLSDGTVFKIVKYEQEIVSAASLDIDSRTKSAELTDCATLPDFRGQGLMSHLITNLEAEAVRLGLFTVYTIARALSVGINTVFARHGYKYGGRFINNCDICGKFEDMNLWSKKL